jgi:group I intron endonuclease
MDSFSFSIIEFCEKAVLLEREQVWLNILFSTLTPALIYNIARDAFAPFLGRTHTAETKAAMSTAHMGNRSRTGMPHSPETKAAISEAMSGENHPNYGKSLSDATKAAISEALKGNTNRVGSTPSEATKTALSVANGSITYVYDSNNILVGEFPSHTAAAKFLGLTQKLARYRN